MDLPRVNQQVTITPLRGSVLRSYKTFVEDVDSRELVVAHPMAGSRPITLMPGDALRVEFMLPGQGVVQALTRVVQLENRGIPVVVLALEEGGWQAPVQRRQFVRLATSLPLTYTVVWWPGYPPGEGKTYRSRTRDLSAGGAQILCHEAYPRDTQLDMDLELPGKTVHLLAEVVRKVESATDGKLWMAVRFVSPDDSVQEAIVRYIFEEERQRRRKGLL